MVKILQLGAFWVNDESPFEVPHVMRCILCYSKPIGHEVLKQRRRLRKGLLSYFNNNGIISVNKQVDVDHGQILKTFQEARTITWKVHWKDYLQKRFILHVSAISNFFGAINHYKKDNAHKNFFVENFSLLIVKHHFPI